LIDPTLEGKSREEMGLEPFVDTEIRSSITGIPVFISQDVIAYVIRRASEGNFKDGLDNNKRVHGMKLFIKPCLTRRRRVPTTVCLWKRRCS